MAISRLALKAKVHWFLLKRTIQIVETGYLKDAKYPVNYLHTLFPRNLIISSKHTLSLEDRNLIESHINELLPLSVPRPEGGVNINGSI